MADNSQQPPRAEQINDAAASNHDLVPKLKLRLEETRLPADLKAKLVAELPSPEERERLFRELQEQGGLSSEQFLDSLNLEAKPQP
jgi:hypothetical protein